MTATPAQLRQEVRAQRLSLLPAQRRWNGQAAARRITGHIWWRRSHHIATYLSVGGELDLHALIEPTWAARKRLYLPVLAPFGDNRLWFAPFTPDSRLTPNRFGILEPAVSPRLWRHPRQMDLVITPLVAFDPHGHRLGMGGGYYDRSFAFRRQSSRQRPRLLGAAHALQRVADLPVQPWDVPLDGVVTELDFHLFPHKDPP